MIILRRFMGRNKIWVQQTTTPHHVSSTPVYRIDTTYHIEWAYDKASYNKVVQEGKLSDLNAVLGAYLGRSKFGKFQKPSNTVLLAVDSKPGYMGVRLMVRDKTYTAGMVDFLIDIVKEFNKLLITEYGSKKV